MSDTNITFSRVLLGEIAPAIRLAGFRTIKDAWVWTGDRRSWEFHGPNKFYWHGRADNAYDARFKGWSAFLDKLEGGNAR